MLGGKKNVKDLKACAYSRIRVELINSNALQSPLPSLAGVDGIMSLNHGICHLLVGDNAQLWTKTFKEFLD
jgi:phosphotransferase system IIB component